MADNFDKKTRSKIMASIKSKNTKPEIFVRKLLHGLGFRFSLHKDNLPGKPDLYFRKYNLAMFVHGCFWHQHDCKKRRTPQTNTHFWKEKLKKNKERDERDIKILAKMGIRTHVIWECEIKNNSFLENTIRIVKDEKSPYINPH